MGQVARMCCDSGNPLEPVLNQMSAVGKALLCVTRCWDWDKNRA